MNYCLIDESDPGDFLECEGDVLYTFFNSSGLFKKGANVELIRKDQNIEGYLKNREDNQFNIVHFSAHGNYTLAKKTQGLDYSMIVKRRLNKEDIEIFRPDSIVRTRLKADLFFSTNCETFNPHFIEIIKNYPGISNFIAPVNSPKIGNTLIFAMIFYNALFRKMKRGCLKTSNKAIIESFILATQTYKSYSPKECFKLYNRELDQTF